MELEQNKKELSNTYIDLGNGFKFSIEDIVKESHDIYGESIIIKVHPSSKRWIEIEQKLKSNEIKNIKKETSIQIGKNMDKTSY